MIVTDIMPTTPWWYSLLPLIIAGVVIIGVAFLIVIGVLIGRRVTINIKVGGAAALTLASVILLSGLWCMFLSPTATYSEVRDSFYRSISIGGLRSWNYSFTVKEGDTLDGSVSGRLKIYDSANTSEVTFNVVVYDPDNSVAWSENNATYSYFTVKAMKSGIYKVETRNPNTQSIECYVQITVQGKVTSRPLEPLGQWLSLISLPVLGLGAWSSGLLAALQKKPKE